MEPTSASSSMSHGDSSPNPAHGSGPSFGGMQRKRPDGTRLRPESPRLKGVLDPLPSEVREHTERKLSRTSSSASAVLRPHSASHTRRESADLDHAELSPLSPRADLSTSINAWLDQNARGIITQWLNDNAQEMIRQHVQTTLQPMVISSATASAGADVLYPLTSSASFSPPHDPSVSSSSSSSPAISGAMIARQKLSRSSSLLGSNGEGGGTGGRALGFSRALSNSGGGARNPSLLSGGSSIGAEDGGDSISFHDPKAMLEERLRQGLQHDERYRGGSNVVVSIGLAGAGGGGGNGVSAGSSMPSSSSSSSSSSSTSSSASLSSSTSSGALGSPSSSSSSSSPSDYLKKGKVSELRHSTIAGPGVLATSSSSSSSSVQPSSSSSSALSLSTSTSSLHSGTSTSAATSATAVPMSPTQMSGSATTGLAAAGRRNTLNTARGNAMAGGIDVLLVEDVRVSQKIAHAALTRAHYKVDVAGDGERAVEMYKLHVNTLRIILMDIHLPGISGIEATERIRRLERENRSRPVLIFGLTGDVDKDNLLLYEQCGMNGCIQKGKLLADAVKQAVSMSESRPDTFVNMCEGDLSGGSSGGGGGGDAAHASGSSASVSSPSSTATSAAPSVAAAIVGSSPLRVGLATTSASSVSPPAAVPVRRINSQSPHVPVVATASSMSPSSVASSAPSSSLPSSSSPASILPSSSSPTTSLSSSSAVAAAAAAAAATAHATESGIINPARSLFPTHSAASPVATAATATASTTATSATQHSTISPSGPNLLLVEDVRVSQRIAQQALQRIEYRVEVASDGEIAVAKFRTHYATLRVVLMDVGLPGISGIEATEQIRSIEQDLRAANTPRAMGLPERILIFGLTGNVDEENLREYQQVGMNGCILKGKLLVDAVRQAVEQADRHPNEFINLVGASDQATVGISPSDVGGTSGVSGASGAPLQASASGASLSAHASMTLSPRTPSNSLFPATPASPASATSPSAQARSIARPLSSGGSAGVGGPGVPGGVGAAAMDAPAGLVLANARVNMLREEVASPDLIGTPRAAQPRQLLTQRYAGRGVVRPGVGLASAGSSSGGGAGGSPHSAASPRLSLSDPSGPGGSPPIGAGGVGPAAAASVAAVSAVATATATPPATSSAPLTASPLTHAHPHHHSQPSRGLPSGPDALLVEDVRVSQRIAQSALTRAHFKVEVASDGETAVERFKQHAHSLRIILMDVGLPGITGIEATERIRRLEADLQRTNESYQRVLIFGLTGNVAEDNLVQYKQAGMNGCIVKGTLLVDAVRDAMERVSRDPDTFVDLIGGQ